MATESLGLVVADVMPGASMVSGRLGSISREMHRQTLMTLHRRGLCDYAPHPNRGAVGDLVVSGFLQEGFGLGVAARLTLAGLSAANYAPRAHDLRGSLGRRRPDFTRLPGASQGGVWIIQANPVEMAVALAIHPEVDWAHRIRIGYWVWETPDAPRAWARYAAMVHELWVPSVFVAESMSRLLTTLPESTRPILRTMPHPVRQSQGARRLARFGFSPGQIYGLVVLDARSSIERKNPWDTIEAWRLAFPVPDQTHRLVIKTSGMEFDPASATRLHTLAATRPDILIRDEVFDDQDMQDLFMSVDFLISTHRAEGFGIVMAEAMAAARPVIATGWSGNMDYMDEACAILVPHKLVETVDPAKLYRNSVWAQPDVRAAADAIIRLCADAEVRARLGLAGRRRIRSLSDAWSASALAAHLGRYVGDASTAVSSSVI